MAYDNRTFIEKFLDGLSNLAKPSEKSTKKINARNESIEKFSDKINSFNKKYGVLPPAIGFLFFLVLALILQYFDI